MFFVLARLVYATRALHCEVKPYVTRNMTLIELLDIAKERTGSDPKTAEAIGISKGGLSEIRKGKRPIQLETADALSKLVGVEWHQVVAAGEAHRATDAVTRKKWLKKTELGATVAGLVVAMLMGVPNSGNAHIRGLERNAHDIHYEFSFRTSDILINGTSEAVDAQQSPHAPRAASPPANQELWCPWIASAVRVQWNAHAVDCSCCCEQTSSCVCSRRAVA